MATEAVSNSIYLPEPATVVKVEQMTDTEKLFELKLNSGRELGHQPGQFITISVMGIGEAPISVSSSPTKKGGFELVVRQVGRLTGALHRLTAGSHVGIRGPFGTNFPIEEAKGKDVLFVGGGIGLVPLALHPRGREETVPETGVRAGPDGLYHCRSAGDVQVRTARIGRAEGPAREYVPFA